eukprot:GHVU01079155.1.p1 GENE.GHVU01079155.1~~GHVU01079155.1.p1  ORF type:complete len:147 (-),score=9.83 GHVU01079155.1:330-770(-)
MKATGSVVGNIVTLKQISAVVHKGTERPSRDGLQKRFPPIKGQMTVMIGFASRVTRSRSRTNSQQRDVVMRNSVRHHQGNVGTATTVRCSGSTTCVHNSNGGDTRAASNIGNEKSDSVEGEGDHRRNDVSAASFIGSSNRYRNDSW